MRKKTDTGLYITIAVIAFLMLLPLCISINDVVQSKGDMTSLLRTRDLWPTIGRSLLLALCTCVGGAFIAVPQAWLLARCSIPFKKVWLILFVVPLVIPSYISAYSYLAAFGHKGFYEILLGSPFPLAMRGGLFGTWLSMTLVNSPFIFLMTYTALLRQPASLEESARLLGCSPLKAFFRVTLPNLKIPIASGMLLVALYTLSDFGTPAILNYKTLTFNIFNHLSNGSFDRAAIFALILIIVAALFLIVETFINRRSSGNFNSTKSKNSKPLILSKVQLLAAFTYFSLLIFIGLVVPIGTMLYWYLRNKGEEFGFTPNLSSATGNSLLLALLTAIIATLLALPVAWVAVRKRGFFAKAAEKVSFMGNMFPGIVVALAFVSFFAGFRFFGFSLYQTMALPILGLCVRFIPQALSAVKTSLTQLNPRLEEASMMLGYGPFATARRVIAPLIRPGLLSGFALVFISTLKELPITLVLAPPGKRFLTQEIWDLMDEGEYSLVAAPALLLLGISCLSLFFILNKEQDLNDDK